MLRKASKSLWGIKSTPKLQQGPKDLKASVELTPKQRQQQRTLKRRSLSRFKSLLKTTRISSVKLASQIISSLTPKAVHHCLQNKISNFLRRWRLTQWWANLLYQWSKTFTRSAKTTSSRWLSQIWPKVKLSNNPSLQVESLKLPHFRLKKPQKQPKSHKLLRLNQNKWRVNLQNLVK